MGCSFAKVFGNELGTFIMSMVPMIELKGGIIFARSVGLSRFNAFFLAFAGSSVVFLVFFFLLRPLLTVLKKIKFVKALAENLEIYFSERAERTLEERKIGDRKGTSELALKMLAVFIFVAIPLPLTGVWAGTAIAVFLNLKFHQAILPVCLGNFVAGLLISGLAEFCLWVSGTTAILDYILWGLLALAVLLTVIMVIKINRKKGGGAR